MLGFTSFDWCCCSVAKLSLTLCDPMNWSMPDFPVLYHFSEFAQLMFIESVMPSNHLILCHPLLLLPSIFPSIRVFSNELAFCVRWPKYWSLSINPFNEYSELISFKIDCFDLFAVQGTHKSSLAPQFKSINFLALSLLSGPALSICTWLLEKP